MTAVTNFRLPDDIKALLKALAAKNNTSQVALLSMLIRQRARQEGLLPPLVKTEPEPLELKGTARRS